MIKADGSKLEKNINFLEKQNIPVYLLKNGDKIKVWEWHRKKSKKVLEKIFT